MRTARHSLRTSRRMITLYMVLALLAAACGNGNVTDADDSADSGADGEPIIIGAALGFTGIMETYEGEAFVTAELAAEDINERGGVLGRPIEFVSADTRSDPNTAPTAANEVLEQGADIILTGDFDFGGPAALVALEQGKLAMSLHASPPAFGPEGLGDLAFSAGIMTTNEAAVIAEWAYNEQGWRTAYELEDTTLEYTRSSHEYFREAWEQLGGTIVGHDTWQNPDESIAGQVNRLRGLDEAPDLIFLSTYNPGGASAIRQIRAADIDVPIVTGQAMDGSYWIDAVPNLSNLYAATYGSVTGDDTDPFVNELRERFNDKEGRYPSLGFFVNGYNTMSILAEAIERAGSVDGEQLKDALEGFDGWESTPLGETCYSERWHVSDCRPFSIVEFQQGEPSFVGRFQAGFVPEP